MNRHLLSSSTRYKALLRPHFIMTSRLPTISESSDFSVTLSEAAERAQELNRQLDEVLLLDEDPVSRLGRQLSHRSVISTTLSFAQRQEQAAFQVGEQKFEFLDNGWCGDVFSYTGKNKVLKRAKRNDEQLWNDYQKTLSVRDQVSLAETQKLFTPCEPPRIPVSGPCIPPNSEEWWEENGAKFPDDCQTEHKMPVLVLERILPLTKPIREDIIDVFCAPSGRAEAKASPGNKNCIVRLYLGQRRRSQRPPAFFRLKNFSLHLDQAEKVGLDINIYATEMAIGLAICHWRVHVDANDVEFVLGSAPTIINFSALTPAQVKTLPSYTNTDPEFRYHNYRKRTAHLWMLDFDKCKDMAMNAEGVEQAVKAAENNDPYFPKPHQKRENDLKLWEHFKSSYLWASSKIIEADQVNDEVKALPATFIDGWEHYRKEKLDSRSGNDKH
jgi:Zinc finger protein